MAKGIKTGGRKKGTQNKVTQDIKELVLSVVQRNFDNLQKDFDNFSPEIRTKFIIQLLKYVLPVPTDNDMDNDSEISEIKVTIVDSKEQ